MVDRGRLLSGCWVFSSTEGSNPSLPAKKNDPCTARVFVLIWLAAGLVRHKRRSLRKLCSPYDAVKVLRDAGPHTYLSVKGEVVPKVGDDNSPIS